MKIIITPEHKIIIDIALILLTLISIYQFVYNVMRGYSDDTALWTSFLFTIFFIRIALKKHIYKEEINGEYIKVFIGLCWFLFFSFILSSLENNNDDISDVETHVSDIESQLMDITEGIQDVQSQVEYNSSQIDNVYDEVAY